METPFVYKVLGKTRSILAKYLPEERTGMLPCECDADVVSSMLYDAIMNGEPCMIARFGSTELGCLTNYLLVKRKHVKPLSYLLGRSKMWWWNAGAVNNLSDFSGFFPRGDIKLVEKYCELFIQDINHLDILGSWHNSEADIKDLISSKKRVLLPYLEPYWAKTPWTKALEGKKVLVVHPFAELIEQQYKDNRKRLFENGDVLPEFNLATVKAVQSLGGECDRFKTWFDALEWMEDEIDKHEYDVCIIGCGAYGFHLAAHVKRSGKIAIHVGGATQLLFGIKGNRWEDPNYGVKEWGLPYGYYCKMFNESWVKAGAEYKPKNAQSVENACYW